MNYKEIVSVTGIGGLFQLLSTKSDGAIVRNITDKSTKFISARLHNVTPLESIEVYTSGDNVRLHEVFKRMQDQESTTPVVDGKADNNAIKAYFDKVYPDFDPERVYVSDMKKMVKWYHMLKASDLLNFEEVAEAEAPAEEAKAADAPPVAEEKPAKKAAKKKPAETTEGGEETPAPKKASKKKSAEATDGEEKPAPKKAAKKKTAE